MRADERPGHSGREDQVLAVVKALAVGLDEAAPVRQQPFPQRAQQLQRLLRRAGRCQCSQRASRRVRRKRAGRVIGSPIAENSRRARRPNRLEATGVVASVRVRSASVGW